MKRKPLIMKSLVQYLADFVIEIKKQNPNLADESLEYEVNIIKDYIDYIFKNPK